MPNQNLAKVPAIDPEFAAAYAEAESPKPSLQRGSDTVSVKPDSEEDPLLTLKAMAEANMKNSRKSSECEDGFDRIENDVSNVVKTCFDFITRPL